MDKVLLSGLLGAVAGALGFYLAQKIHGKDKAEGRYPLYALALFGAFHTLIYVL